MFSRIVTQHWMYDLTDGNEADSGTATADKVTVVIDPTLASDRTLSLLRVVGGPTVLAVTPDRARELSLTTDATPGIPTLDTPALIATDLAAADLATADLTARIEQVGITLNDPDYVFYFSTDEARTLTDASGMRDAPQTTEPPVVDSPNTVTTRQLTTRQLTADDAAAFAQFEADAPADDLDEAYVELDHWLVYGTFVDGRLAAASSMYPWGDTKLADVGVITLPEFRGRGLGTTTVRAISARAFERGFEPQYRCQIDNTASVALARSSGFTLFGEWKVILPADES